MGLRPQRREMVDVELVEDESPAGSVRDLEQEVLDLLHVDTGGDRRPSATGSAAEQQPSPATELAGASRPRAPRFSRRVGVVAVAGVVAVTVAVVNQQVTPMTEGDLVGGAPSLISPLAQEWRLDTPSGWTVVGDLLLATSHGRDGLRILAHDLVTGAERWVLTPPEGTNGLQCPTSAAGPQGPVIVCRAVGHVAQMHHLANGTRDDPGQLVLVSAADGTVGAELPLPVGYVGFASIDGDIVLADLVTADEATAGLDAEMSLHVERRSFVTGQTVWTSNLPVDGFSAPVVSRISIENGIVLVTGPTTAVIDGSDGRQVRVWRSGRVGERSGTPGHVSLSTLGFGLHAEGMSWLDPTPWFGVDGSGVGSVVGDVTEPAVHDDSAPGVVLVTTPGHASLRGVDLAADKALWSVDLAGGEPVVRLDGAVVVSGHGMLRSIDLRTGQERWRSSSRSLDDGEAVSDGSFVLATGTADGHARAMSAVSLHDGSLLWRTPMPAGTQRLAVFAGHVLAVGPGVVVGLG